MTPNREFFSNHEPIDGKAILMGNATPRAHSMLNTRLKVSKSTLGIIKCQLSHNIYNLILSTRIHKVIATTTLVIEDIIKLQHMRLAIWSQALTR